MKVAIVTAHYTVGRGYMENVWADLLARRGHEVTVLASHLPADGLSHAAGHSPARGVAVRRFPCRALPSGLRLEARGLVEELDRLAPEVILWVNVGSHFGRRLLHHKRRRGCDCKLVCFFGENSGQHRFHANGRPMTLYDRWKAVGWRLLRGPLYRQAVRTCDLAVGVTAETPAVVLSLFPPRERERLLGRFLELPLGYDGSIFRLDRGLRRRTRRELGLCEEDVVLIVSSRMTSGKVRKVVRPLVLDIAEWTRRRPGHRAMVVGFSDTAASRRLSDELRALDVADRLILHDLADRPRLSALLNAADIGVFASPSISIQEAMGTGLYMVLGDDGSMDHLVRSPEQGCTFRRGDQRSLFSALACATARVGDDAMRARRRQSNAWLDYAQLSRRLFDRLLATDELPEADGLSAAQARELAGPALAGASS